MFVLAIDTSSPAVTAGIVSLAGDVVLAAQRSPLDSRGHGELLAPAIRDALAEIGSSPRELRAIVAGTGPGPFTGLRVGLVTAAVMAELLAIPAYGVCSLDAIADACADEPDLLVAADARRREVYWARYRHGVRDGEPQVTAPAAVATDGVTALAGAGAELYADVWPGLRRRGERYPDPVALVRLARERIESGAPSDPLTPLYLRRPDAVAPGTPKRVMQ